ncbi:MAG: HD domain-containing phosphohydrolase [Solirubrobacterales bacterium]
MKDASLKRYLPHVVIATFTVAVLPALGLVALQLSGVLRSPLLSVVLGVVLSSALANAASAYWMRRPGSLDIVFGDLLVWGWIRRVRTERRLGQAASVLGDIEPENAADVAPAKQVEALQRLASALEARDPYTHGHTRRVTRHAEMIAMKLGLSRAEVAKIRTAAAVHDVGKLRTPREILNKPASLTDEEFAVMKRHSSDSAEMAEMIGDDEIVKIVRHHHERLDGSGYPDRLCGSDIPLGSRIIAVADSFDAMTSSRAYRAARKHGDAIKILKAEAGKQLDGEAVDAFLSYYVGRKSVKWWGVLVSAPQRVVELFGVAIHSAGSASIAQGVAAVAATAVIGSSLGGQMARPDAAGADRGSTVPLALAASYSEGKRGPQTADGEATSERNGTAGSARPGSKPSRPQDPARNDKTPGTGGHHGEAAAEGPKAHPDLPAKGGGKDDSAPSSGGESETGRTPRTPSAPTREAPSRPVPATPTTPAAPDNARQPATPQPPSPPSAPSQGGGKSSGAAGGQG